MSTDAQDFDLDDVFNNAGGGGGAPSFEWPSQQDPENRTRFVPVVGGEIVGEITDIYVTVVTETKDGVRQPRLNKRGKQMPQVNLTVQTTLRNWDGCKSIPVDEDTQQPLPASEDTGERRIYVKYRMLDALAKAIKESPQKRGGPRVGAKIAVQVSNLEYDKKDKTRHPLPDYKAKYRPPAEDPAGAVFDQANAQQAAQSAPASDPWATATTSDEPSF